MKHTTKTLSVLLLAATVSGTSLAAPAWWTKAMTNAQQALASVQTAWNDVYQAGSNFAGAAQTKAEAIINSARKAAQETKKLLQDALDSDTSKQLQRMAQDVAHDVALAAKDAALAAKDFAIATAKGVALLTAQDAAQLAYDSTIQALEATSLAQKALTEAHHSTDKSKMHRAVHAAKQAARKANHAHKNMRKATTKK